MERATAITAIDLPLSFARDLLSGERITNPESQNTGMETIYPAILMARGDLSLPTTLSMEFVIASAAPVFSRIVPMMVPATITIPMYPRVEPKPFLIAVIRSASGIPTRIP